MSRRESNHHEEIWTNSGKRNSEELKASIREHASWLMSQHEMSARICYVNECGFGLYTSRAIGPAIRGLPARKVTGRTPNITMLCTIHPKVGLIHHIIIVGGVRPGVLKLFAPIPPWPSCELSRPLHFFSLLEVIIWIVPLFSTFSHYICEIISACTENKD